MANRYKKDALFHRDLSYSYPVLVRGEGIYVYDEAGKCYIDGAAGAGNLTLGHGRQRIAEVMAEQAEILAYCFSTHFTNQPAVDFAARVAALAPDDLDHVYFVSGGSEGVETAIKIARQYHVQCGSGQKHLVISRWRSYHGATLGALSATGAPGMRAPFEPLLAPFPHIAPCYPYRCPFAGCEGRCNLTCASELEKEILQVGPENVAAFIAEPVVMSGVAAGIPPPDYYPLIREICDKYNVLFIADEVITGFGRTGKYFAIEHWDVTPDMIVFGKGVSSGYSPLSGVIIRDALYERFAESGKPFAHIFTYVNNPVAMRVGLTVLDIIEEEGILEHVIEMGEYLLKQAETLKTHSIIGEIRGIGLMLGIELVRDPRTKEPFPASLSVNQRIGKILLAKGLSVATFGAVADWVNGDDIRFHPPLIITRSQIDDVLDTIDAGLTQLQDEISL